MHGYGSIWHGVLCSGYRVRAVLDLSLSLSQLVAMWACPVILYLPPSPPRPGNEARQPHDLAHLPS